jgi:hypothetical protein
MLRLKPYKQKWSHQLLPQIDAECFVIDFVLAAKFDLHLSLHDKRQTLGLSRAAKLRRLE